MPDKAMKHGELQAIAAQKGGHSAPGRGIGKIVGLDVAPVSFRGLTPIFWLPPEVRDWACFPIDGETPAEIVKPGGVGLIDERHLRIVLFRTLPKGMVCDRSSVPDILARITGITKSDMMPQGIFHDTGYRYGLRDYAWEIPFSQASIRYYGNGGKIPVKRVKNEVVAGASLLRDWAKEPIEEWGRGKGMWDEFHPDQQWCDDLLRVLLLNFNSGVLKSRRRIGAWLAVRLEGDKSFRDKKMAKTCERVAARIAKYCAAMK